MQAPNQRPRAPSIAVERLQVEEELLFQGCTRWCSGIRCKFAGRESNHTRAAINATIASTGRKRKSAPMLKSNANINSDMMYTAFVLSYGRENAQVLVRTRSGPPLKDGVAVLYM